MRIRFLKSVATNYGGFNVGQIADIPNEAVVEDWCKRGIAKKDTGTGETARVKQTSSEAAKVLKEKPDKIPKSKFWCGKCHALHRLASAMGMKHLKHRA